MKIIRHAVEQPFVTATGAAALIHSTWSLGTLFAGQQPDSSDPLRLVGWLAPALLISFAMDVGQISTSAKIRDGHRNWRTYTTFFVFALATYYLQWLYIAHHMPKLELSAGVVAMREFATVFRDFAVWFVPALLPMSTLLYTFAEGGQPAAKDVQISTRPPSDAARTDADPGLMPGAVLKPALPAPAPVSDPELDQTIPAETPAPALPQPGVPVPTESAAQPPSAALVMRKCADCGIEFEKENELSADNALKAHRRHCSARRAADTGANGHKPEVAYGAG